MGTKGTSIECTPNRSGWFNCVKQGAPELTVANVLLLKINIWENPATIVQKILFNVSVMHKYKQQTIGITIDAI